MKSVINTRYKKTEYKYIFPQYKLYIESADKISFRRNNSNKFYLTLNSILFGLSAYLSTINKDLTIIILLSIGIIASIIWRQNIISYKKINSVKFKIIKDIEKLLPLKIYGTEDVYMKGKYKISSTESYIPIIFLSLYAIILFSILIKFIFM